jgi:uncharacterized phage protein (TIGR01671 family)
MREIKFRAWDRQAGHMAYLGKAIYMAEYNGITFFFPSNRKGKTGIELMQFTGLRDSRRKRIYEGDILREPEGGECDVVEWNKESGGWGTKHWFSSVDFVEWAGVHEVIGNIYENPELLNK